MNDNKLKNILILVLLAGCLVFASMWYFSGSGYKSEIKTLKKEKQELVEQRKNLDSQVDNLKRDYEELVKKEAVLLEDIKKRDREIQALKESSARSQAELMKIKKDLAETRKKIEEFKKNPPNRTGQDLINSLKIKLQLK